jgi:hypothetical protein
MLDRSDYRSFVHAPGICHRRKTLLAAHLIDHPLLPSTEDRVRKDVKIAEHPQQV